MRNLKLGAAVLLGLIFLGLAAVILTDRMAQPKEPDPATLIARAGAYHARILRDGYGVPHIFGHSDADVAFGLGFAHSEDDYATIQDVALATRGKLAASEGAKAGAGRLSRPQRCACGRRSTRATTATCPPTSSACSKVMPTA